MIITVTLNTDFADVCLTDVSVTSNKWADIIARERVASGKGVNAARIVSALHGEAIATGFVGVDVIDEFSKFVAGYGVEPAFVSVDAPTRSSIYVLPREGAPSGFRAPGFPPFSKHEVNALVARVSELVQPNDWVLLGGSAPDDDAMLWSEIGLAARDAGAIVVWDAYGNNMRDALEQLRPDVIKLNEKEVELTFGLHFEEREALTALQSLASRIAILTTGQEGSLMAAQDQVIRAWCPNDHRRIEIGAGDSFAGGLVHALANRSANAKEALRFAAAVASAYVDGNALGEFTSAVDRYINRVRLQPG
jgi:fructose-1-phosphate kinase PfkB-like protein